MTETPPATEKERILCETAGVTPLVLRKLIAEAVSKGIPVSTDPEAGEAPEDETTHTVGVDRETLIVRLYVKLSTRLTFHLKEDLGLQIARDRDSRIEIVPLI